MNRLALVSAVMLFASTNVFAQEACKPAYHPFHSACKSTGNVLSSKTTRIVDFEVNAGACKPNPASLMSDGPGKIVNAFPGTALKDITGVPGSCHAVDHDIKRCGDFFHSVPLSRVLCSFDVVSNTMELVSDDSCPVIDVTESTGCYNQASITVDSGSVNECLELDPKSPEQWMVKAACLADLSKAAQSFKTKGLTPDLSSEIKRQVALVVDRTNAPGLEFAHNFIVVREQQIRK